MPIERHGGISPLGRRTACNEIRAYRRWHRRSLCARRRPLPTGAGGPPREQAVPHGSRRSLEDAHQAVSDTEAGRQLKGLANGKHRHEKAQAWQASVFWGRAEQRSMHHFGSKALSRAL
jgi:hypothetical protein